ncbi:MAG: DUF881 domain-containing protein [Actinomycetota bacterium]|nr:DUF881 domain-containing protein [Actinomycetota bacterium]
MPERPPARRDGSMSLLVDVMTHTLDESYAEAAERRSRTTAAPGPTLLQGLRRTAVVLLLVVLGLLSGTAAAQVRARSAELDDVRSSLAAEVQRRTRESDALVGELERLRAQVQQLQAEALGSDGDGRDAAAGLEALALAAGTVPVTGPGLVVELDDAPPAEPEAVPDPQARGGAAGQGRVLDRDLQDAVNGLWAAGAEAVSVNELRLSALTAIRSAGEAVLVDFRPLSPPYVVRAVGDPEGLERRFEDNGTGPRLADYSKLYGIEVQVRRAERLRLPAATAPGLEGP